MLIPLILFAYTIPMDSPLMENMDYLYLKGFTRIPLVRPYEAADLLPQIDNLVAGDFFFNRTDARMISRLNRLFGKHGDYTGLFHASACYDRDTALRGGLDTRLGGKILPRLSWNQGMRFRFARDIDSLGPKPWKDHVQAYLCEGNLQFESERIKLLVGRRNYLLGPGDEHGLILSPAREGYDGFMIRAPSKYYEFYTTFFVLDAIDRRYLSVHRLGLDLKNITLGFSESILFANDLEPLYLNFLLPYYLSQWGMNRDDNIMWNLDIGVLLFKTYCYAELLIDDYMYEGDPYPSKLAYQIGLRSLVMDHFLIKGNYAFVDKWVYTHENPWNTYESEGMPLGFDLGNDCDRLTGVVSFMHWINVTPSLKVAYMRQGEGNIRLPYEVEGGDWDPPFPSGVVRKTLSFMFSVESGIQGTVFFKASVGKDFIKNHEHLPGNDENQTTLNAGLWLVY